MEKHRAEKSVEDSDFDKIIERQRLREARQKQSGKDHLMRNLKAKKGMQLVNQEGTFRKFSRRERLMTKNHAKDDLFEWKNYWQRSDNHKQKLQNTKPDIVDRINEQMRLDKESERQEKESNKQSGCYEWSWWESETESENEDESSCKTLTKDEHEHEEQEDHREREAVSNWLKHEQKEKRQRRREELKRAIAKPIAPLPERELCQYEKIREDIIRERKQAMANCKFFEDLQNTKERIGFYTNEVQSVEKSKGF